ncbi:hypothetical protein EV121DRAFT_297819 [Schizophyllum commune]
MQIQDLSRPVSEAIECDEAIERDDNITRMPDRRAGPVIRRADRARFLTFNHHHAACVAPSAVSSPPPSSISPNTLLRTISARLRGDRAAQDYVDLRITTNAPASGEEEGSLGASSSSLHALYDAAPSTSTPAPTLFPQPSRGIAFTVIPRAASDARLLLGLPRTPRV